GSSQSLSLGQPGTYTVFGRIFDKGGGFTDYSTTVTVRPTPAPPPTRPDDFVAPAIIIGNSASGPAALAPGLTPPPAPDLPLAGAGDPAPAALASGSLAQRLAQATGSQAESGDAGQTVVLDDSRASTSGGFGLPFSDAAAAAPSAVTSL